MKLLVIGGGGREHAIVKKLRENPAVEVIYCLPGNGGIAADAVCVPEIGAKDIAAQAAFAKAHGIDYAVVAPDDPLALGAVVRNLKEKNIYFIPDENLGRYVAKQLPEKHFIFNDGFCHVHKSIHADELLKAKEAHPEAEVLTHPECTGDVLELFSREKAWYTWPEQI